ncbi:PilW family protein [Lysinibacillus boronitolerans]|uniref:PilW family protein n=1 Tax=Lysinibacillus boronitolerans TaxID=309788 RepID=UPI0038554931
MSIRHNQKGLTLVELLAAIVITTIIVLFLYNLITLGLNQNNLQSQKNNDIKDASYALKLMTEDLRKTSLDVQKIDEIIEESSTLKVNNNTYSHNENTQTLELNNVTIARQIKNFNIFNVSSVGVKLSIETTNGKKYSAVIMLREGD